MHATYNVLVLGASYGSLLATKLLLAGHTVKLICRSAEAELINKEGSCVACCQLGERRSMVFRVGPAGLKITPVFAVNC